MRVKQSGIVYPQDVFAYKLPDKFMLQKRVSVTGRPSHSAWIGTQIVDVDDGHVYVHDYCFHTASAKCSVSPGIETCAKTTISLPIIRLPVAG